MTHAARHDERLHKFSHDILWNRQFRVLSATALQEVRDMPDDDILTI